MGCINFLILCTLTTCLQLSHGQQVFLSLGTTTITTNNSEILITDVVEGIDFSLICHTDLPGCCTSGDGLADGEWYYPDGTVVPRPADSAPTEPFYRTRGTLVVRLNRRTTITPPPLSPTGSYCCVIPTMNDGIVTYCANLVVCPSLTLTNGMISYSDPTLGVDSVATFSCNAGYILSTSEPGARACQSNGLWSGLATFCKALCPSIYFTNGEVSYNQEAINGSYIEDTVATYSCSQGHVLIGSNSSTCQSDRTWLPMPYCTKQAMAAQLRFGPTEYCLHWTEDMVSIIRRAIHEAIREAVLTVGNHTLPIEHISKGVFSCYGSKNHTTFRVTITGTDVLGADEAVSIVQKWVESEAAVQVLWYLVFIDENCPVSISTLGERECGRDEELESCVDICVARRRGN